SSQHAPSVATGAWADASPAKQCPEKPCPAQEPSDGSSNQDLRLPLPVHPRTSSHPTGAPFMRPKSLILLSLALGCGLIASLGINQVMSKGTPVAAPSGETEA